MTSDALAARLSDGVAGLGLSISGAQQAQLLRYLGLLTKWNGVYNLTAVRNVDDMLALHLLDSLSIWSLIDQYAGRTMLDVGSGAGLPGIPLAIVRPELTVTTIDAVAKKISFQQQVKTDMKINNLVPIHGRVEALTLSQTPSLIVSRAYTALAEMLKSVNPLVSETTTIIAMKGVEPTAEIAQLPQSWTVTEIRSLDVPFLGARRCAVVLRRSA